MVDASFAKIPIQRNTREENDKIKKGAHICLAKTKKWILSRLSKSLETHVYQQF